MLYFLVLTSGLGSSRAFVSSPGRPRPCGSRVGRLPRSRPGKERGSSTSRPSHPEPPPHRLASPRPEPLRCSDFVGSGSRNRSCQLKRRGEAGTPVGAAPACSRRASARPRDPQLTHRSHRFTHTGIQGLADHGPQATRTPSHSQLKGVRCTHQQTPRSTNVTHTAPNNAQHSQSVVI